MKTTAKIFDENASCLRDISPFRAAPREVCVRGFTGLVSGRRALAAGMIFTVASVLGTAAGAASGMPTVGRGAPTMMFASESPHCRPPEVYVKGSGCVVVQTKPTENTLTKETAGCPFPMVKQGSTCVCAPGYSPSGKACIKSAVVKTAPPMFGKPPPVQVNSPPVIVTTPPTALVAAPAPTSGGSGAANATSNSDGGSPAPSPAVAAAPAGSRPAVVVIPVPGEKITVIPFDAQ
jgi:hypothetical protein